jgi:hypothetical protein
METLGAILLLLSAGVGLLLLGSPERSTKDTPEPPPPANDRILRRLVLHRQQKPPKR